MKTRLAYTLAAVVLATAAAPSALAADAGHMPMQGMMGDGPQGTAGHHGMMGQQCGMMGQQGMMNCPMMGGGTRSGMMGGGMRGGMMGSHGLPALPPGNEKLQLQMQAEIMQKVGEILAKYAAQVQ